MKLYSVSRKQVGARRGAFTLIEMIGVLAVIAILAAVLVPKVFEAINNSRINSSALSCDTVKTAIIDHYAKFNGLNQDGTSGTAVAIPAGSIPDNVYDIMLLKEQFLDKPFICKIGDGTNSPANTHIELLVCPAVGGAVAGAEADGYNLSGTGATNECNGSYIVQAVITGVSRADAQALSKRIDGDALSTQTLAAADTAGRVKYVATTDPTIVYVYLTHR